MAEADDFKEYRAPWWEWDSPKLDETLNSIRLQKPRLWVLIHF